MPGLTETTLSGASVKRSGGSPRSIVRVPASTTNISSCTRSECRVPRACGGRRQRRARDWVRAAAVVSRPSGAARPPRERGAPPRHGLRPRRRCRPLPGSNQKRPGAVAVEARPRLDAGAAPARLPSRPCSSSPPPSASSPTVARAETLCCGIGPVEAALATARALAVRAPERRPPHRDRRRPHARPGHARRSAPRPSTATSTTRRARSRSSSGRRPDPALLAAATAALPHAAVLPIATSARVGGGRACAEVEAMEGFARAPGRRGRRRSRARAARRLERLRRRRARTGGSTRRSRRSHGRPTS